MDPAPPVTTLVWLLGGGPRVDESASARTSPGRSAPLPLTARIRLPVLHTNIRTGAPSDVVPRNPNEVSPRPSAGMSRASGSCRDRRSSRSAPIIGSAPSASWKSVIPCTIVLRFVSGVGSEPSAWDRGKNSARCPIGTRRPGGDGAPRRRARMPRGPRNPETDVTYAVPGGASSGPSTIASTSPRAYGPGAASVGGGAGVGVTGDRREHGADQQGCYADTYQAPP